MNDLHEQPGDAPEAASSASLLLEEEILDQAAAAAAPEPWPDYSKEERFPKGAEVPINVVRLDELGFQLPLGNQLPDGNRNRELAFRDLGVAGQLDIANFREKTPGCTAPQVLNEGMRLGATKFGGVSPCEVAGGETKLLPFWMRQWVGDMLTAWVLLRYYVLGPTFRQGSRCPSCGIKWDGSRNDRPLPEFDLSGMDIFLPVNPPRRFEWFLALRDGITLERGGKSYLVKGLWVRPALWGELMKVPGVTAKQRLANTKAFCIVGAETEDGQPVPMFNRIAEAEMLRRPEDGGFSTYDAEMLELSLSENTPGPRLALSHECSVEHGGCGFEYETGVDWRHEVFYSSSPRSRRSGKR